MSPAARDHAPCAPGAGGGGPRGGLEELTRAECLRLLADQQIGRLAVGLGDGPPLVRPVNYRFYDPLQSVVFRSAPGTKLRALLTSTHATFEVDRVDEATRTGWSVIIQGTAEEITDPALLERLERLGELPWAPGPRPVWMHIRAFTVSGRRIPATGSAPGLYLG
jgi:nitroimidazol reductase NimA-like FMN-containing flavoprotein (pyridoxamine 5'-phosphate oxidase superfamily)